MKLKFDKNTEGEISVQINGKSMGSEDYITLIKEVKSETKIEADFGGDVTLEERGSIDAMLKKINKINSDSANGGIIDYDEEEIKPEDIPF